MTFLNQRSKLGAALLVAAVCATSFAVFMADDSIAEGAEFDQASYLKNVTLTKENLIAMHDYDYYFEAEDEVKDMVEAALNIMTCDSINEYEYSVSDITFSGKGTFSCGESWSFDGSKNVRGKFIVVEDRDVTFKLTMKSNDRVFDKEIDGLMGDQMEMIEAIGINAMWVSGTEYTGHLDFEYTRYYFLEKKLENVGEDKWFRVEDGSREGISTDTTVTFDGMFGKGITVDCSNVEYVDVTKKISTEVEKTALKPGDAVYTEMKLNDSNIDFDGKVRFDGKTYEFVDEETFMVDAYSEMIGMKAKGFSVIGSASELEDYFEKTPKAITADNVSNIYCEKYDKMMLDDYGITVEHSLSGFRKVSDDALDDLESSGDSSSSNLFLYVGGVAAALVIVGAVALFMKRRI